MLVDLLKKEEASMIDSAIEPNGMNKLRREVDSYGRKEVFWERRAIKVVELGHLR